MPGQFMVEVPMAKSPQTSSLVLGEVVAMPVLPVAWSTNRILAAAKLPVVVELPAMERSAAKVEEAETITPMVEVGLMAFAPINCQLDPPSLADQ